MVQNEVNLQSFMHNEQNFGEELPHASVSAALLQALGRKSPLFEGLVSTGTDKKNLHRPVGDNETIQVNEMSEL